MSEEEEMPHVTGKSCELLVLFLMVRQNVPNQRNLKANSHVLYTGTVSLMIRQALSLFPQLTSRVGLLRR